jgi:selenocysteine lyase/cysteine desulfurase
VIFQDLLEQLAAYKVRPSNPGPPYKFETGTLNHEGLAGVAAAVEYLAQVGRTYGRRLSSEFSDYKGRRKELKQAMGIISVYERPLFSYMLAELEKVSGVKIYGISNPEEFDDRCPTLAFTRAGYTPEEIATQLGKNRIFVWHGNYYALAVTEKLGVENSGGMVRVGLAHYNTKEEVDRFLNVINELKLIR